MYVFEQNLDEIDVPDEAMPGIKGDLDRLERMYSIPFMPAVVWQEYLALVCLAHGSSMALWAWRKRRPEMSLRGLEYLLRGLPLRCSQCGQASCVCPLPF